MGTHRAVTLDQLHLIKTPGPIAAAIRRRPINPSHGLVIRIDTRNAQHGAPGKDRTAVVAFGRQHSFFDLASLLFSIRTFSPENHDDCLVYLPDDGSLRRDRKRDHPGLGSSGECQLLGSRNPAHEAFGTYLHEDEVEDLSGLAGWIEAVRRDYEYYPNYSRPDPLRYSRPQPDNAVLSQHLGLGYGCWVGINFTDVEGNPMWPSTTLAGLWWFSARVVAGHEVDLAEPLVLHDVSWSSRSKGVSD